MHIEFAPISLASDHRYAHTNSEMTLARACLSCAFPHVFGCFLRIDRRARANEIVGALALEQTSHRRGVRVTTAEGNARTLGGGNRVTARARRRRSRASRGEDRTARSEPRLRLTVCLLWSRAAVCLVVVVARCGLFGRCGRALPAAPLCAEPTTAKLLVGMGDIEIAVEEFNLIFEI